MAPNQQKAALDAIDRLERKHIFKFGHNRGFIKKIAWRINAASTLLSRWHIRHKEVPTDVIDRLIAISNLEDPYRYQRENVKLTEAPNQK